MRIFAFSFSSHPRAEHREANASAGGHPSYAVRRRAAAHQVHQHERTDGRPNEGLQGPAGYEHVERAGEGHFPGEVSKAGFFF